MTTPNTEEELPPVTPGPKDPGADPDGGYHNDGEPVPPRPTGGYHNDGAPTNP
ncbi:MAG: hypothetical protein ABW224_19550 [Kibdelosporangium sp.]